MKIKYSQDTDLLHVEFRAGRITETRDMDETPCWTWTPRGASTP